MIEQHYTSHETQFNIMDKTQHAHDCVCWQCLWWQSTDLCDKMKQLQKAACLLNGGEIFLQQEAATA